MKKSLTLDEWFAQNPDVTEADFARRIGLDRRLVNKWRRWVNPPTVSAMKLIELETGGQVTNWTKPSKRKVSA